MAGEILKGMRPQLGPAIFFYHYEMMNVIKLKSFIQYPFLDLIRSLKKKLHWHLFRKRFRPKKQFQFSRMKGESKKEKITIQNERKKAQDLDEKVSVFPQIAPKHSIHPFVV